MAKVLVIDDSMMVRVQVSRALRDAGYDTVEACDGFEALQLIRDNEVSLAICDVNMPAMSGIEFLEEIVKVAPLIPVLMLTTEGQPALIHRAKALGAKGWIIKPFKTEILLAATKRLAA